MFIKKSTLLLMLVSLFGSVCAANPGNHLNASSAAENKIIYLTFDDGPINNTARIVSLLREQGIHATFMINGYHLYGQNGPGNDDEKTNDAVPALLDVLKNGDVIGNHSYEHEVILHKCGKGISSDPYFASHFCSGLSISTSYFNPAMDFALFEPLNTVGIQDIIYDPHYELHNIKLQQNGKYFNDQLQTLARMPYSNIWRVHGADGDSLNADIGGVRNSFALADKLAAHKYNVYGWDIEWGPTDWSVPNYIETLPNADDFAKQTEEAFRSCSSTAMTPAGCVSQLHKNKIVILTHDFEYENSFRGNGAKNLEELKKYIILMKAKGYKFDTLDNYAYTYVR